MTLVWVFLLFYNGEYVLQVGPFNTEAACEAVQRDVDHIVLSKKMTSCFQIVKPAEGVRYAQ